MTRKDFVFIAATLKGAKPDPVTGVMQTGLGAPGRQRMLQWVFMVHQFAHELQATHPNFDRPRFEIACGLEGR
jgi:hypothetical protein